jgi:hypothetical protein
MLRPAKQHMRGNAQLLCSLSFHSVGGERPRQNLQHLRLEVTSHQGGIDIHLLRRLLGQSQPSLTFWYAGFLGIAFAAVLGPGQGHSEGSFWTTIKKSKGAAGSGSRDAAGEQRERGGKKTGGGG